MSDESIERLKAEQRKLQREQDLREMRRPGFLPPFADVEKFAKLQRQIDVAPINELFQRWAQR